VIHRASEINIPVLILHGTEDNAADGGSPVTEIARARQFETVLRSANKVIKAKYYEGGRHNSVFSDAAQYEDTVQRISAFLMSATKGGLDNP
jgi:alpha-beta hydrolase superfamily lysophospholipase